MPVLTQAIQSCLIGSTTQVATGSGNIATTVAPAVPWVLLEVRLHLSAAGGANNFTATMDAGAGAAYDCVLLTQDMTSAVNVHWQPDRPIVFSKTDELDFAWTNSNSRTYGLEIVYGTL
jgi:hypothetical protein